MAETAGATESVNAAVYQDGTPFKITHTVAAQDQSALNGFSLDYSQLPCTSSVGFQNTT